MCRVKRKEPSARPAALGCSHSKVSGIAKDQDNALATPCRITASGVFSIVATVSHAVSGVRSCGSWSSTVVANIDT